MYQPERNSACGFYLHYAAGLSGEKFAPCAAAQIKLVVPVADIAVEREPEFRVVVPVERPAVVEYRRARSKAEALYQPVYLLNDLYVVVSCAFRERPSAEVSHCRPICGLGAALVYHARGLLFNLNELDTCVMRYPVGAKPQLLPVYWFFQR